MEGDFIKINSWLRPLSWCYGIAIGIRNMLFEMGVLKSHAFNMPVISVGTITVGGTGKTPHVEYLIQLLKDKCNVAVLSRGYKRKKKGFIIADKQSTASDIGDEPNQIKCKYPNITVAVDKDRVHGINQLMQQSPAPDVVLLDDAFQHRYVKPGVNILLVDYHRLVIYDTLLPAGRMREPLSAKDRADIVIITKCPKDLKPMEFRVITKAMNLYPYQRMFFTTLQYKELDPVFKDAKKAPDFASLKGYNIMLLTGIASPEHIIEDINLLAPDHGSLTSLAFPDHHAFNKKDIQRINETFQSMAEPRIIITTEKDAARLHMVNGLSNDVSQSLFALPIKIQFLLDQEETFNEKIIGYVRKNSRNSILVKKKDDNKSDDSNRTGDRPRTISFRNN